ncbi:DUF397 domain-containing protein [Streptomyces sp. MMCC 100]|uniref:DUF397 domain-containing protein n=1 Tax=Streptomyces sp. MMCC 100 TaxID=3163555 RepID=UPI0035989657
MTDRTIRNSSVLEGWRKSSLSIAQGGSCVEVMDDHPAGVPVRDSKVPGGAVSVFSVGGWASFITAFKEPPPPQKREHNPPPCPPLAHPSAPMTKPPQVLTLFRP